jgi:GNAT superfamily N-acetyltransferase
VEIAGETIAEFDAGSFRIDGQAQPRIRATAISDMSLVVEVQAHWETASTGSTFHWPAVLARNLDAQMLALHDGTGIEDVLAFLQCRFGGDVACGSHVRQNVAYVTFVEVAPSCRNKNLTKFKALGSLAIAMASGLARQTASRGALGLHAVESAAGFYRRLGFVNFDCLNEYKELYFELSSERAREVRSKHGVGR